MKITLDIPDEMRCLSISGVMAKDGKLLLTRNEANYIADAVRIAVGGNHEKEK